MDEMKSSAHDVEIMGGPRDGEVLENFRGTVVLIPVDPTPVDWSVDIQDRVLSEFRTERWEIRAHKNGKYYAVDPKLWKWHQKSFKSPEA